MEWLADIHKITQWNEICYLGFARKMLSLHSKQLTGIVEVLQNA